MLLGCPWALVGCPASRPPPAAARHVLALAEQSLHLPETGREVHPVDVTVIDARRPGHGRPSLDGLASAEQAMRTKGVMMDPVYTAKALAMAPRGASAVFWHTGGVLDAVAAEEGRL